MAVVVSFFRTTIYLALVMLVFNLGISFVGGLETPPDAEGNTTPIFPVDPEYFRDDMNESEALSNFSTLSFAIEDEIYDVTGLFTAVTSGALLLSLAISVLTRSVVPIGIAVYGAIFWGLFLRASAIFSFGGWIPIELIGLFMVVGAFVFVASIIGMLTGSG